MAECTVTGCNEDPTMSPTGEDPTCPRFQPNIFDPSRCHDCLRQKHLHSGARESTEATPQQKPAAEPENGVKTQTDSKVGRVKGVALTPIPFQEEERDTSSKEDSDSVSAVSSYCDVRGGSVDRQDTPLCILSPDCELYICDGDDDDSTDSCLEQSDYQGSSGSGSAEDEYLPIRRHSTTVGMTRLDPPPHRPNPRAWMEEAQSRDGFNGTSGLREDRAKRESGYFSLGRAAGVSLLRDNNPSGPFRHYERGHPIFSTENVEPKDTIPFRNPSLGVASERQKMTVLNEDLLMDVPSPDLQEVAIEVEAQVGPRSPSPTPFKIAESLASTGRKGLSNSYNQGSSSSPSTYRHSGRMDTSRRGSPLQSRSSSPSRGSQPFRRCESAASIGRHGSASGGWTRGLEMGSGNSLKGGQRTCYESGTLPRNFKSYATTMKSQSTTVSDFRSALRKTEASQSLNGCTRDGRSSSPLRRDCHPSGQMSLRKTELSSRPLDGHRYGSRASSPSWKASGGVHDSCGSSPQRRNNYSSSQSFLRTSESVLSLSGHSHHGRCGSPIREGYDIESQALLRNEITQNGTNDQEDETQTIATSRRSMVSHSALHKRASDPAGHSWHNQGSSTGRKNDQTSTQFQLRRTKDSNSLHGGTSGSRSSSPLRRSHEMPSQFRLQSRDSSIAMSIGKHYNATDHGSFHKTEASRSLNSKNHSSRNSSPSRKGSNEAPGYSVLKNAIDGDSSHTFNRKNLHQNSNSDSYRSSSWRESARSHCSSSLSRVASPFRQVTNGSRASSITRETHRSPNITRSGRPGPEECSSSRRDPPPRRQRSPSPASHVQMQGHISSHSSMESSESGPPMLGPSVRNREEYVMIADVPKVKIVHQREADSHTGRPQNQRPSQRQELFKPASHSLSKHPSRDWEDTGDAEWQYSSSGYLSQKHSCTSLQRSDSPPADEGSSGRGNYHRSGQMQPDLLNFKKGWMSKLDNNGEWKKHWFVLSDAGLKYYRDSSAEEKDDLDGEIDLKSCVRVSEFDVEKNYGFQIQTQEAAFTLSAMTAGIRRNWIEVLKKCIRPSSSPDLTQLPDRSSDKENSHSRFMLPSHRPLLHRARVQPDPPASAPPALRGFDYVELSPVPTSSIRREAGEGQGMEHSQWQEERNTTSQWEALLSRKGTGAGSNQRICAEEEIEKKWAEFETMPLKEMSSRPAVGSWTAKQSANEALQREVASLRQQLEEFQGRRGGGGRGGGDGGGGGVRDGTSARGGCGPEAPCSRSLAAMEHAQRQALEELQRQHERQMKEVENEKNRLLLEETQDTTRVIEALKKNHKEELERELEKVRRLSGGGMDAHTLQLQQKAESQALHRELAGLSERYSQKCLELNRAEQNNAEREQEICRKERDLEQLKKENQDLKARLKDEMSRVQSALTDQHSEANKDRTCCELEVLLRMKENEIEYLHKEISCLRNELQFLKTEKHLACERYTEIQKELSGMKGRSEREIQNLKEHLSLAMAALQEGQKLGNSLDH